jgi:transposase-like protein
MRRQYTGEQRSKLVELVTSGQATVSEAAARLGVAPATGYYWLKNVGRQGAEGRRGGRRGGGPGAGTTFARAVPSAAVDSTIAVRVSGAEIQVRQGFDAALLREVVAALLESTP